MSHRGTRSTATTVRTILPEGSEVDVMVTSTVSDKDIAASRAAAGGWKGTIDADTLMRNIYEDRLIVTRPTPRL